MPFVSALTGETRRWRFFIQQGIKIAARLQCLHNLLEALLVIANSTIGCIRKFLRHYFSIKPGCFTGTDGELTPICKGKHQLGAIRSDNALPLANRITQF
jgi:hypothetical protein